MVNVPSIELMFDNQQLVLQQLHDDSWINISKSDNRYGLHICKRDFHKILSFTEESTNPFDYEYNNNAIFNHMDLKDFILKMFDLRNGKNESAEKELKVIRRYVRKMFDVTYDPEESYRVILIYYIDTSKTESYC